MENDIGEANDVSAENPKVVAELTILLEWAKKDIGDLDKRGENARPLGDEPYFEPNDLIPASSGRIVSSKSCLQAWSHGSAVKNNNPHRKF